jgi:SRSO17 transposase
MRARKPTQPTASAIEDFAGNFDHLFNRLNQRENFRQYLSGLLVPLGTNKHLRGIAAAIPGAAVEALQHFLVDAPWSLEAVNKQRLEVLQEHPDTHWHEAGALIIDETGDRKKGSASAFVSRQYLGSIGKIDNGVVSVSSHWADEHVHYPLSVLPYTAAERLEGGKQNPHFATKPQLAQTLIEEARQARIPFAAVVADSFYGEHVGLTQWLRAEHIPFVLALKPTHEIRQYVPDWANPPPFSPQEAAQRVPLTHWQTFQRTFADGHQATWYVLDLTWGHFGPEQPWRLVVSTPDPLTLSAEQTTYLYTALPASQVPPAEIARLYCLRAWIEVFYRQAKGELGWHDWQVRQDRAILRHWHLIFCAYTFVLLHGLSHSAAQKNDEPPASTPLDGLLTLRASLAAALDRPPSLVDRLDNR